MVSARGSAAALGALAVALGACGGGRPRPPTTHASGPAQFVEVLVPEPARGDLGLSGRALDQTALLDVSETPGLLARIGALVPPARACVEPPGAAWVTFRIWSDGHASVERVATLPASARARGCLEAAVSGWTFPEPPAGRGVVLLQIFPVGSPPSEAVFPVDPEADAAGLTVPTPVEPGCVAAAMARSPGAADLAREEAHTIAMFAVDRSGGVSRFHVLEPTPLPVAAAVRAALEACRWRPSVQEGRTVGVWVIRQFRFAPQ